MLCKINNINRSQCTVDDKLAEVIRLIGADNTPVISKAKY